MFLEPDPKGGVLVVAWRLVVAVLGACLCDLRLEGYDWPFLSFVGRLSRRQFDFIAVQRPSKHL